MASLKASECIFCNASITQMSRPKRLTRPPAGFCLTNFVLLTYSIQISRALAVTAGLQHVNVCVDSLRKVAICSACVALPKSGSDCSSTATLANAYVLAAATRYDQQCQPSAICCTLEDQFANVYSCAHQINQILASSTHMTEHLMRNLLSSLPACYIPNSPDSESLSH